MNPLGRLFIKLHARLYRATGGRIGSWGGRVLILTTKGAKSGKTRHVPVMFFEFGGRRFVIASFAGSPTHPAWFKNLQRNPDVSVQVNGKRYNARATVLSSDERAKIWPQVIAQASRFADYEKKVGGAREIPVVELKEVSAA
jgi:deazaflavin-dependent oxidoreductase (nitroreductase family)